MRNDDYPELLDMHFISKPISYTDARCYIHGRSALTIQYGIRHFNLLVRQSQRFCVHRNGRLVQIGGIEALHPGIPVGIDAVAGLLAPISPVEHAALSLPAGIVALGDAGGRVGLVDSCGVLVLGALDDEDVGGKKRDV